MYTIQLYKFQAFLHVRGFKLMQLSMHIQYAITFRFVFVFLFHLNDDHNIFFYCWHTFVTFGKDGGNFMLQYSKFRDFPGVKEAVFSVSFLCVNN